MADTIPLFIEDNTANIISNLTSNLPPEIATSIGTLLTIFKAAGIVLIIYLIFLIISIIFNLKRYRLIKKTWQKVQEIDEKLERILHKKNGTEKYKKELEKGERSKKK